MKKSLILVGLLSIEYAHAQYDGKVGINTDKPEATLDIRLEDSKLADTTNEGIIAPKLSKTRVADIAVPVEGTLVYVTNEAESLITAYTGTDIKVAKIDEKGYYYFDGTEWVKAKNVVQDQEWVYDDATKRINLRRSGDAIGTFKNKVFYNVETGQYIDTDSETEIPDTSYSDAFGYSNGNISLSDLSEAKNISFSLSNNLKARTDKNGVKFKGLNYYRMNIAPEDIDTNHFRGNHYDLLVPAGNTNNYTSVYGDLSFSSLYGSGTVGATIGQWGQLNIGNNQGISAYGAALLGSTSVRTSSTINGLYGILGRNIFASKDGGTTTTAAAGNFENSNLTNDNTLVKNYFGVRISTSSNSNNIGRGIQLAGIYNQTIHKGKTKYPNMYGIFTSSSIDAKAIAPDNHYGLYINNVQGGSNNNYGLYINSVKGGLNNNYAIYTKEGQVRLGDNTVIKTDVEAPKSVLTTNGMAAFGGNTATQNRSVFVGSTGGSIVGGTFVGFGAYPDSADGKFKTSKDNHSTLTKNRFFMFNALNGKFYFSPFIAADGKVEEEFNPINESALTIVHEGKKVGIGTNTPKEKLEVAGAVKIGTTDACTRDNAGTIRFDAGTKKFQGCTGDNWVDLH